MCNPHWHGIHPVLDSHNTHTREHKCMCKPHWHAVCMGSPAPHACRRHLTEGPSASSGQQCSHYPPAGCGSSLTRITMKGRSSPFLVCTCAAIHRTQVATQTASASMRHAWHAALPHHMRARTACSHTRCLHMRYALLAPAHAQGCTQPKQTHNAACVAAVDAAATCAGDDTLLAK